MGLRLFDNPVHLVLLLVVILIVFGAGKLPGVGAALGNSIKEFKKAAVEGEDKPKSSAALETCSKCQALIPAGAQFCSSCGAPSHAQVGVASSTDPSAADAAVCVQCGSKNAALARFCAQCGSALGVHAT